MEGVTIVRGVLVSVNVSRDRGGFKDRVGSATLVPGIGVDGDSHAGRKPHRQVSLLAEEFIDRMRADGLDVTPGSFSENLTTRGIDLDGLPVGTLLMFGDGAQGAVLKVSHLGHICHGAMRKVAATDERLLDQRRVFAIVERGGVVEVGQPIIVALPPAAEPARVP